MLESKHGTASPLSDADSTSAEGGEEVADASRSGDREVARNGGEGGE